MYFLCGGVKERGSWQKWHVPGPQQQPINQQLYSASMDQPGSPEYPIIKNLSRQSDKAVLISVLELKEEKKDHQGF